MGPPESRQQSGDAPETHGLGHPGLQLLFLFVLALALRIVAVGRTAVIFNDGPEFLRIADAFSQGAFAQALTHPYHPLYPACIALLSACGVSPEAAAVAISVVSGSLAVLALYAFLRLAFGWRVAFVGATLLAIHPYAIRFSADVQSDALYLAFFLGSVAALYSALAGGRWRLAVLAGGLSGLGYLTRPEGLGVALVGLLLIGVAWLRGRWGLQRAMRMSLGLGVGVAITAFPYWLMLRRASGSWQLSQKKSALRMLGVSDFLDGLGEGVGPVLLLGGAALCVVVFVVASRGPRAVPPRRWGGRVGALQLAALFAACVLFAGLLAPTLLVQFAADVVSTLRPELALLLGVGIAARSRAGPQGRSLFISTLLGLYAILLFGLLVEYGYLSRRHALPPLVLVFGYVALGAVTISGWSASWASRWGPRGVLVMLICLLALISFPKAFHDHRGEELAGRLAAEWLREAGGAEGDLASNKSKLGYYADRPWQSLHWQHKHRGLADLESTGVRWLILEETALDESLEPLPPFRATRRTALEERRRFAARGHQAIVFEVMSKP
jgi:4-amino-4-deoxy-L-arabinose transferase-like glycosyltransferase